MAEKHREAHLLLRAHVLPVACQIDHSSSVNDCGFCGKISAGVSQDSRVSI
jgi:hypothetical protein